MGGQSRNLAQILADLAVELQDRTDAESTLRSVVDAAVMIVPGARWAGISLIEGHQIAARVPSDPLVVELDELQSAIEEGPCVSALREHRTVYIEDMATEHRWRRFTEAAAARGVGSLLSFQLFVHSRNLGALNLYGTEPRAFDEESTFVGELLAQHASVAIIGAASVAQFREGIASRDVIGQAKGLLMHREQLTDFEAFALMVKTSQESNIKLLELARWLVEQHVAGLCRT